jgi:hypothetical protein
MADAAETFVEHVETIKHEDHLVGVVLTAIHEYQNGFDRSTPAAPEGAWSLTYLQKAYKTADTNERSALFRKVAKGLTDHIEHYFSSTAFERTLPEHVRSYADATRAIADGLMRGGSISVASLLVTAWTPFWKVSVALVAGCYGAGLFMYSLVQDEEERHKPKIQEALKTNLKDEGLMYQVFMNNQPTIEQALYTN